jgi:multidrug efflux system membrane fusion protein
MSTKRVLNDGDRHPDKIDHWRRSRSDPTARLSLTSSSTPGHHAMTPVRTQNRTPLIRLAIATTLMPLVLGMIGCQGNVSPTAKAADKPPVVVYDLPVMREITDYEDFVGQTQAVKAVEIRARVTGYLDKVNFEDGSEVAQDAVLFEIDPRSYQAVASRTEAGVVQSDAHFKRLERDFRRAQSLVARDVMPQEEFDKVSGDYAEAGGLLASAKADNDLAKLNLSFTKVTAPISGRLSRRYVDPGNLVRADDTLLTTIVALDPMYIYFDIDERVLLKLRRLIREGKMKSREEAEVPILARLSDSPEGEYPIHGLINFSDNRLDASTGTLRVRAVVPNPKPRVFSPGLYVKVRLPVGTPHMSVMVPDEAIVTDQGKKFVWIINDKQEIEQRTVQVGASSNRLRVIEQGIKPGETPKIVVRGLQRVKAKLKVDPQRLPDSEKLTEGAPSSAESPNVKPGT